MRKKRKRPETSEERKDGAEPHIETMGARPPLRKTEEQREGARAFDDQLRRGHWYKVACARIERAKRGAYFALRAEHPEIAPLVAEAVEVEARLDEAIRAIKDARDGVGRKWYDLTEEEKAESRAAVKHLRAALAAAYSAVKEKGEVIHARVDAVLNADLAVFAARRAYDDAKGNKKKKIKPLFGPRSAERARIRGDYRDKRRACLLAAREDGRLAAVDADFIVANDECQYRVDDVRARTRRASGLLPGSYLLADQAISAACKDWSGRPSTEPFRGDGRVGVKLGDGIPVADLFTGESSMLQLVEPDEVVKLANGEARRGAVGLVARVRVGSKRRRMVFCGVGEEYARFRDGEKQRQRSVAGEDGAFDPTTLDPVAFADCVVGREYLVDTSDPLFAEFPVLYQKRRHPLPTDGVAKWAWVLAHRIGTRTEYKLQIVCAAPSYGVAVEPAAAPKGRPGGGPRRGWVAIDLGWRVLIGPDGEPTGKIRVGYWADDEGRHGELLLPERAPKKRAGKPRHAPITMLAGMEKVDDLRSIRGKRFESARDWLVRQVAGRSDLPEWFRDRTRTLAHWRSEKKLASLFRTWLRRRFRDDEHAIVGVALWEHHDRHLYDWQESQRDHWNNHRDEVWKQRAWACGNHYDVSVVGDMDIRDFKVLPLPEDDLPSKNRQQRRVAALAAPGRQRSLIEQSCAKFGSKYVEQGMAWDTRWCACDDCGYVNKQWDTRAKYVQTCAGCKRVWDQDHLGALNRLRRAMAGGVEKIG